MPPCTRERPLKTRFALAVGETLAWKDAEIQKKRDKLAHYLMSGKPNLQEKWFLSPEFSSPI
jgi:hypothetical protein